MKTITRNKKSGGFGLVELLVVIGILGVIASVLIPSVFTNFSQSKQVRAKHNAQLIVRLAQSAAAMGDDSISNSGDKNQAISRLIQGVQGRGHLSGKIIKMGNLPPTELQEAADLITFQNGMLAMQ